MKTVAVCALLCVCSVTVAKAADAITKMECPNPDGVVTTLLEINSTTKMVTQSAKWHTDGHINGPYGPYPASITKDAIKWRVDNTVGRAVSFTYNTVNLKKKTYDVVIDNGPGETPWKRLNTPCTP
jgi:hypothetical protein